MNSDQANPSSEIVPSYEDLRMALGMAVDIIDDTLSSGYWEPGQVYALRIEFCRAAFMAAQDAAVPAAADKVERPACPACGARGGMHPYVACDEWYHRAQRVDEGFEPLGWHAQEQPLSGANKAKR